MAKFQAKNTSVILGDHLSGFVQEAIASGRYDSQSEVVRAGLRLLEEDEVKLRQLRAALIEGERSGEPISVTRADIIGSLE